MTARMSSNAPDGLGPFAIYRVAKITTLGQLGGSAGHMMRTIPTPNADKGRAHLNRRIVGGADPASDVRAMLPALGERSETGHLLRRANSVLALEVLLTVSPEWWDAAPTPDKADWERRSIDWLKAEYGAANIAALHFHGDEKTGHLTGYIVPRDPDTGALNARRWTGGAWRLSAQQTAYAAAVEPLGLQRGIRGSTAEHEAVKRYYGALQTPTKAAAMPVPPRVIWSPKAWAQEAAKQMMEDLKPTLARSKIAGIEQTKRKAAEAQAVKDRARADRAGEALEKQKKLAGRLRSMPLPDVLEALGFERDPREKIRWRADGFNVTVGEGPKAGKWFDHAADHGRGGAIDLVQHVMGTDFKGALAWLADRFGDGATVAEVTAQARREAIAQVKDAKASCEPFTPPPAIEQHWPHVARYLTEERGIPAPYVAQLHERGDVYADSRRNAVFLCKDPESDAITGAELKGTVPRPDGTRFAGMAPGSRKDSGGFIIGRWSKSATVYLVESAIDAISLMRLRQIAGDTRVAIMSTAGTKRDLPSFLTRLKENVRRVCGYDNDLVGDKAAQKLTGWERERPEGKDWNDDLRARVEDKGTAAPVVRGPAPDDNTPAP